MNTSTFVEDAGSITPKQIIENQQINFTDKQSVNYWTDNSESPSVVCISIEGNEPQVIALDWDNITFGKRAYFICSCGSRANKLFLPRSGSQFKCRDCHGLQYQLTSFNRSSVAGRSLYRMNRLQKLSEARANMGRILYDGQYTKRFERFLNLCDKAGYESIVTGARDLKALIQAD